MRLSELKVGESATVDKIGTGEKERERLFSMGLTEGVTVTVVKKSPFGSPTLIKVRDFYLALRTDTLKRIAVKV